MRDALVQVLYQIMFHGFRKFTKRKIKIITPVIFLFFVHCSLMIKINQENLPFLQKIYFLKRLKSNNTTGCREKNIVMALDVKEVAPHDKQLVKLFNVCYIKFAE